MNPRPRLWLILIVNLLILLSIFWIPELSVFYGIIYLFIFLYKKLGRKFNIKFPIRKK